MRIHFRLPAILFLFLISFPYAGLFAQNQNCCKGGEGDSQNLSGTCPRILPNNPVRTYSIARIRDTGGSIVELANGELLVVWSKFTKNGKDDSAGWTVGRRSKDKGKTWGDEFTVMGVLGMENSISTSLLVLPNGDVLFFVLAKHDQYEIDIIMCRSTDNGYTWSCPQEINNGLQQAYHVMNNDRVIQLKNQTYKGRIVCPVSFTKDITLSISDPTAFLKCVTFYSDDGGVTWNKGNTLNPPAGYLRGLMEPEVIELNNGDLMMLIRTRNQEILQSISTDGGVNWGWTTPLKEAPNGQNIVTTSSPCTIGRIPCTGDLLLIYSNGINKTINQDRSHLVYRISTDEGKSWGPMGTLKRDVHPVGYSYPSLTFVEEQALLTYYVDIPANMTSNGIRTFSTELRTIPIGWFYGITAAPDAGTDTSICDGLRTDLLANLPPTGVTGRWSVVAPTMPPAYSFSPGANFPNAVFSGAANTSYQLTWEFSKDSCRASDTVEVAFWKADAGSDMKDCWQNSPVVISAARPLFTTGSWSVISGTAFWISNPNKSQTTFSGSNQVYQLQWRMNTPDGCISYDTLQVDLTDCGPLQVESEKVLRNKMTIDLSNKRLMIKSPNQSIAPADIFLYDVKGRLLWKNRVFTHQEKHIFPLEDQNLSKGVYFVILHTSFVKFPYKVVLR